MRRLSGLLNEHCGKIDNCRIAGAPNERRIAFETDTTCFILSVCDDTQISIKIKIKTDNDVRHIDLISGEVTHE